MKNIHILATDKPSRLHEYDYSSPMGLSKEPLQWRLGRNIYITPDEEIREGDWCLDKFNQRWKLEDERLIAFDSKGIKRFSTDNILGHDCKKIILTTDQDLIGVQAIDDEFLEWFVKNPSCEVVEVVKTAPIRPFGSLHKIIIPKEEAKHKGKELTTEEVMESRSSAYEFLDFDKKETLGEADKKSFGEIWSTLTTEQSDYLKDYINRQREDAKKWQQERSYSEEEVIQFGKFLTEFNNLDNEIECAIKKLLKQFKNK